MEVLLVVALKAVKILKELGKTPYEPLKEGQEEFMSGKDLVIEK
jgi:hypothetical protein